MIEPMLAKEFNARWVDGEYYLQPKLNGHRIIWDGKQLWTRQGKLVVSVPGLIAELSQLFDGVPLDGELYSHGMTFQKITQTGRRTVNVIDDPNLCMYVYDLPIADKTFRERWRMIDVDYGTTIANSQRIRVVATQGPFQHFDATQSSNPQNLNVFGAMYEGTMLRNANGMYKFGKRSSDLLKIKRFHDTEAAVVGVTQMNTFDKIIVPKGTPGSRKKSNGTYVKNGTATLHPMIGALVCQLPNGTQFEIGSGFTHDERKMFWSEPPIGKMVTFQYQELTPDGVPLFPSYLRMREDL